MADSRLVQYGCGLCAPKSWRNFDASPTLRLQRVPFLGRLIFGKRTRFPPNVEFGNVVDGLPLEGHSCDAVYCSHVLEHLSLQECRGALRETYRILRPGGIFRGVLPDLEIYVQDYVCNGSADAALEFMRKTLLGIIERPRGAIALGEQMMGNSKHLWMWDYKSLAAELHDAGFINIRRAIYGDSSEPAFAAVEDEDRWRDSLGFECNR